MVNKIIETNKDKCEACNKCIMACSVKYVNSIHFVDGQKKIFVDESRCIACGACLQACDHGARSYVDDLQRFFYDLTEGKRISLLVAPAVMATMPDSYKKLFGYFKSIGVNFIFDVSYGADITSWGYVQYVKKNPEQKFIISQPCPVIVDYIEKYEPKLIQNLIPVQSPVCCAAIYLKKYYGNEDSIALLSPCIAKKKEIERDQNKGLISYNITIEKLLNHLAEKGINLDEYEGVDFDEQEGFLGKYFSRPGGLQQNLKYHLKDLKIRHLEGSTLIYDYLRHINDYSDEEKTYQLLDVLNCASGCNIGSGSGVSFENSYISADYSRELLNEKYYENQENIDIDYSEYEELIKTFTQELDINDFMTSYKDSSDGLNLKKPTPEELQKVFVKMKKKTQEAQNINCYSCGYKSCKEFAIAIFNGLNVETGCYRYNQQVLKENDRYISAILGNISESVMMTNNKRIIEYVNEDAKNILGYDVNTYIGKPFFDFLVRTNLKPLVNGATIEYKGIHRNGSYRDLKVKCRTIYINDEMKYLMILEDVTKEKEIEVLKNNFVSIISHELRTPLTSIRGAIGLLSSGMLGELSDKAKELLKIAGNNSVRLVNLINDMLDLEKIKAGKIDFLLLEYDVAEMVQEAVTLNAEYATQNDVHFKLGQMIENVKINVDRSKFIQILTNLLSNAAKNAPKGEDIIIDIVRDNTYIDISVTNGGEGIPASVGNKIFDSFFQVHNKTNEKKKGTGLGLNICKFLAEQMGGRIGYKSVVNEYTTFTVGFPEIYSVEFSKNILICEDNKTTADIIRRKFEELQYKVDVANTIKEAKEKLKNKDYDLMSLDVFLPDGNGIELLEEVKKDEKTKNLPVIIVSAKKKNVDIIKKFHIVDWYEKTFDTVQLKAVIDNLQKQKNADKIRILHVEDDVELIGIMEKTLNKFAFIQTAKTIEEAKHFINNEIYDLVILDYKLPDGTSDELIQPLKEDSKNSDTMIVIFSAYSVEQELKNKVDAVILKTQISNSEFVSKIKEMFNIKEGK